MNSGADWHPGCCGPSLSCYHEARAVWVGVSFLIVIATAAWLLAALRVSGLWAPAFVGFTFLYHPLVATLEHGQFYALGLALAHCRLSWLSDGRDLPIGIPLGFMAGGDESFCVNCSRLIET